MDAPTVALDQIDLSTMEFWLRPDEEREAAFRTLREQAPVLWCGPVEQPGVPSDGKGYWSLSRYEDVWQASRNPQLFCSGRGGSSINDMDEASSEFFGSMLSMDDPKHARLRGIVQKGFTPKYIAQVEGYVREKAAELVGQLLEEHPDGTCDFVEAVAAPLPLRVICEMMGIPEADEKQVFAWTNTILGFSDPEYASQVENILVAGLELNEYGMALGTDRLANPRDDLTSVLMHAEVDGQRLSTQELGSFFILLVIAGNETTRNAISWGMKYLTEHPDQRQQLWADYDSLSRSAIEEIVRYATPVMNFRRTATADTEIRGVPIAEGDKVVFWYNSANRDESTFTDPDTFDVRRDPNPHVGFGAGGPHFCLGANLARREITVMLDEIRRRLPDLEITGEPDLLQSGFVHGIKRMPCAWTP